MHLIAVNQSAAGLRHVNPHTHDCWELVVYLQGAAVHTVGETEFPVCKGTIICQPPMVPHWTRSDTGWQDLYLQIGDYAPPGAATVPVFQDDAQGQFAELADFCLSAFQRNQPTSLRLAEKLLEAAQQLLILWSGSETRDVLVDEFVRTLDRGIGNAALDISDLVRRTGYCPDAFRRRFRAATGTTPTAYLVERRIAHAKALLETSAEMSVRQVAALCGYDDPYYFSTLFRRKTGLSPSQWRAGQNDRAADG